MTIYHQFMVMYKISEFSSKTSVNSFKFIQQIDKIYLNYYPEI